MVSIGNYSYSIAFIVDQWLLVAVVQDSTIEKSVNYSYTITKLSPGTTYFFSVVCQNDAGVSDPIYVV